MIPAEERVCKTRVLKNQRKFAVHPRPAALFSGTLHFVVMNFVTPSGIVTVPTLDWKVLVDHATKSGVPISAYASQYGPNVLHVSPALISFTADLGGKATYSDADLQGWVASIAARDGIPAGDALAFFNPQSGVENTDAPVSQGVLGYHGFAGVPYMFVNLLGTGLTLDDSADVYALALSHEIAELTVDPAADLSNPEVCDGCGPNCRIVFRDFFDTTGGYLGTFVVPPAQYAFFINAIVKPSNSSDCPAPASACVYGPPGSGPAPPPAPHPCEALLLKALDELRRGKFAAALKDALRAVECLFLHAQK